MIPDLAAVGLMLASTHLGPMNDGAQRSLMTPGLYVVHRSGLTVGAYRNTMRRTSALFGYTHQLDGGWSISGGLVTGYPQTASGTASEPSRIGPYVALSYAFGAHSGARVLWSPQKTQPIAIAAEWRP